MTISEKLSQIAENEQKVYAAGYAAGQAQGGGGGEDRYQEGYDDGYQIGEREGFDDGYANGQQAEYDRFWDAFQNNGTRTSYQCSFGGNGWGEDIFLPKYSISPSNAYNMFYAFDNRGSSNLSYLDFDDVFEKRGLTLDFSKCTDFTSTFFQANINALGTIDMSSCPSATALTSVFNSEFLRTIRNLIPPKFAMKNTCWQVNLTNLGIGGTITKDINLSRCSLLTAESVQSIIDHLADLTGQTAQTLTFHATVGNKLTQAQKDVASARNWTLAY